MIGRYALIFPWIVFGLVWLAAAPFTKKTVQRESIYSRAQYIVPIAFAALVLESHFIGRQAPWIWMHVVPATPIAHAIGYALEYGGIAFAIWARATLGSLWSGTITLKENHRLVQTGPFAITRHPIYSGLVLAALGVTVFAGTFYAFVGLAIFVASFVVKLEREEALMRETFGDEHRAYAHRVRKLVPYIW